MFYGVTLSRGNYESLLTNWNAQKLQSGVAFSGGNSTYCTAEAIAAREKMITSDLWMISDGGQTCLLVDPSIAPDLTPETDTGASDSDNLTSINKPSFYVKCSIIGITVTLYTNYPTANTAIGSQLCSSIGIETVAVTTALTAGAHNITYTYKYGDSETGYSPYLAVTVDLIFSGGFEESL